MIKIKFMCILLTAFVMIALYGCDRALPEQNQEAVNFESAYQLFNQDMFGKASIQ